MAFGASAVLVFAVPASPLAQPWPVVGGNTLSALTGIACAVLVTDPALAAVLAHQTSWQFAAFPVLVNSLLLVAAGVAYNSATGRRYPHRPAPAPASAAVTAGSRFTAADLDTAPGHYNRCST